MSTMSISGLLSGLNWEDMINKLMEVESRPIALMQQQQRALTVEKDAYGKIGTGLGTLAGALQDLTELNSWDSKKVTSSDPAVAAATAKATAVPGIYDVKVYELAQAHSVASDEQTSTSTALGLSGMVQINGKSVTINTGMNLGDVRDEINRAGAGVRATIVSKSLVLTSEKTGAANGMTLVDSDASPTAGVWNALGVFDTSELVKNQLKAARDSDFEVNGIRLQRETNTISDVISDVTFTLLKADVAGAQTRFEITQDVDSMVGKIQSFVTAYNSTYETIGSLLAKEGALQGENPAMELSRNLRQSVTGAVQGAPADYDQLALIGITTDKAGKLSVDETKLREAIAEDAGAVEQLFTAVESVEGFDGVATRAKALVDRYTTTGGVIESQQGMYQGTIDRIDESIEDFAGRIQLRREGMSRQFTQMELALAQIQGISSALSGQLASLAGLQG